MLPSELHGLATGLLVVDSTVLESRFLQFVYEGPEPGDGSVKESAQQLGQLFQATRAGLLATTLVFEPLVPDDDEPLAVRIEAVCEWVRGLVYGLTEQGIHQQDDLPEDVSGFVNDLIEISKSGYAADEGEEGEMVYADLLEYLRIGTLMVQEELQPIKAAPQQLH